MSGSSNRWRAFFVLSAALLLSGGPLHPGGSMADMLAHPSWIPSHALMFAGFVALLIGLVAYSRGRPLPERTRRWLRIAVIGTALQAAEMAFHTAAVVDQANLVAGRPTPVLTTHLWLSVVCYPAFGASFIGFVIASLRDGLLGKPWIAWLAVVGAAAHGAAAPLVVGFGIQKADILFPFLLLCAVWLLFVALSRQRPEAYAR